MKTANKIMMPNGELIALSGATFEMFDTILKDHILTYEQSKGWALQGTYVYKEAVAGSRYGYPDFYAKCIEEKDLGTPTETVLGENTVTLYTNANGHTFYDIADKEAIDTWYNTYGIAWYYGIDKESERIFLPRTKWFIQPSGEITEVNSVNEAGLPNVTGYVGGLAFDHNGSSASSGALKLSSSTLQTVNGHHLTDFKHTWKDITINASLSNPIYGNSDTVQPPSINQLLYICVGNTNVESAVTDVVDVTTTENDTVPLGYSTYQNGIVPNTSWLKSQGQWNDGNLYSTFYNEFVQKIGQSFASGYVKEITDEYDDYDLVINQDEMTFRLPLLDGSEDIISSKYDDLELLASGDTYTAPANGWYYFDKSATATSQYVVMVNQTSGMLSDQTEPIGTITHTRCNIICKKGDIIEVEYTLAGTTNLFRFVYAQGNGSLYFKVANAVQNLELLDAGEVLESLTGKADISASNFTAEGKSTISGYSFPSSKYIDLTLGASGTTYTAPANGWYLFGKKNASSSQYLHANVNGISRHHMVMSATGQALMFFTPVNKGDVLMVNYDLSGATTVFRFYYANGEV